MAYHVTHIMFKDDIKQFAKTEKDFGDLKQPMRIYSQDIGMEYGIGNVPKKEKSSLEEW